MNEMANTESKVNLTHLSEVSNSVPAGQALSAGKASSLPSRLDELAIQAQMFAQNACMNLLQLGRVLSEARPMIPHGEFDSWCRQHAKMSRRTAEQYMQAYAEFGLDTKIAELGTSKIIKLLPMSEDEREKLLSENDVASMSTRQLDAAIRAQREKLLAEARAEAQAEIEAAQEAARAAERRAIEAERRPAEVPEALADQLRANDQTIKDQQAEIDRLAGLSRMAVTEKQRVIKENSDLRRDLRERDEDMEAMQADLQRAQDELLNLQSAQARGDAERQPSDTLTPDVFSSAVNAFVGTCCRLPQMGRTFAAMSPEDKERYDQSLRTLERWAESARLALNSITYGEAIVID